MSASPPILPTMVSIIDILCFESPKILSVRFEGDEVVLTEKELQEYFNLGYKNISLQSIHGEVERINITTDVVGFNLKASASREFTIHTIVMPSSKSSRVEPLHANPSGSKTFSSQEIPSSPNSILSLIRDLPLGDSLLLALINAGQVVHVNVLPVQFDGDIMFELPVCPIGKPMHEMGQKYDGHPWVEYCTCTKDTFLGVIR